MSWDDVANEQRYNLSWCFCIIFFHSTERNNVFCREESLGEKGRLMKIARKKWNVKKFDNAIRFLNIAEEPYLMGTNFITLSQYRHHWRIPWIRRVRTKVRIHYPGILFIWSMHNWLEIWVVVSTQFHYKS